MKIKEQMGRYIQTCKILYCRLIIKILLVFMNLWFPNLVYVKKAHINQAKLWSHHKDHHLDFFDPTLWHPWLKALMASPTDSAVCPANSRIDLAFPLRVGSHTSSAAKVCWRNCNKIIFILNHHQWFTSWARILF